MFDIIQEDCYDGDSFVTKLGVIDLGFYTFGESEDFVECEIKVPTVNDFIEIDKICFEKKDSEILREGFSIRRLLTRFGDKKLSFSNGWMDNDDFSFICNLHPSFPQEIYYRINKAIYREKSDIDQIMIQSGLAFTPNSGPVHNPTYPLKLFFDALSNGEDFSFSGIDFDKLHYRDYHAFSVIRSERSKKMKAASDQNKTRIARR